MQVPGWQQGFPKGSLCMVKEKKKGMLICKRRQDKNQSYTCKKQVSLPDAVGRLYLHLRLQPKRLKPFPPSPKSPRRPNLLQLLTALKSEPREDSREPSPKPQIAIAVPQRPPCSLCSLPLSPIPRDAAAPSQHTTHSCGGILVGKTPWSMPTSPRNRAHGLATPCPQSRLTACKILHLPGEAELQLRKCLQQWGTLPSHVVLCKFGSF